MSHSRPGSGPHSRRPRGASHHGASHHGSSHHGAPAPHHGTAQPEAGQGTRGSRSWAGTVTYLLIVAGVAVGLLAMRGGQREVRSGTLVVAGVLLAGAAVRLWLPDRRAGVLGSRRRLADAAAFAALGAGLLVAGLIFPVPA